MITLSPEDKKRMEAIRQGNQKRIAERHATLLFAQTITDDAAAMEVAALYPEWSGASVAYTVGHRVLYEGQLYKCLQAHTSQAGWKPTTAHSLWVAISDGSKSGTKDSPITAARGMEYEQGLHYLDPEDGKAYLCTRSATLHYMPHELIGHYFSLA